MTEPATSPSTPMIAYCAECHAYVPLSSDRACPNGHPRSALRDVRPGTVEEAPPVASGSFVPNPHAAYVPGEAFVPDTDDVDEPNLFVAEVLGKGIVILPIALVLGWGLLTGYEQFSGSGMSMGMKLLLSAGSLVGTVALAFLMASRHRR